MESKKIKLKFGIKNGSGFFFYADKGSIIVVWDCKVEGRDPVGEELINATKRKVEDEARS